MYEHRQGVATNGARAESRSEQGWGKDPSHNAFGVHSREECEAAAIARGWKPTTRKRWLCPECAKRADAERAKAQAGGAS